MAERPGMAHCGNRRNESQHRHRVAAKKMGVALAWR